MSVTCDRSVVFSIQHYVIKFVSDLWQVSGFLYTTLCNKVCQWLVTGWWFSLYNMWSSLSVTCDRSVVFSIQHVIKFVSDVWQVGGFLLLLTSTNKTEFHDITEILLNTLTLTRPVMHWICSWKPNTVSSIILDSLVWILLKNIMK